MREKLKQLTLISLSPGYPPVVALSEKQRDAVRSALGEAIIALIKMNSKEEMRDAERQQD